ncbi:hypothetical protein A244_02282, partial [Pseudomonas syringae pv. actinidiae ICMP 18807]
MSAKKAVCSPKMNRLNCGLRGQVRSCTALLLILAEGRGNGLVREKGGVFPENESSFSSDDAFSEEMPALTTFGQNQKQCYGQRECSATVQRRASALSTGAAGAAFDYAHR